MSRLSRFFNLFFGVLAVCLILAIAAGGYYFHRRQVELDARQARDTLDRVQSLIRELERGGLPERYVRELEESKSSVEFAEGLLRKGQYRQCTAEVERVMDRLRPIQGEMENPREEARVAALAGSCEVRRSGASVGKPLVAGGGVRVGDEVETLAGGQALLQLPNEESVVLDPFSALRLEALPGQGAEASGTVKLLKGGLFFRTPHRVQAESSCRVLAASAELRAQPGSACWVALSGSEAVSVQALEGAVEVSCGKDVNTLSGGLEAQTATFSPGGMIRGPSLTAPPHPDSPAEGTLYRIRPGETRTADLKWDATRVPAARVQVSDNPLFARGVIFDQTVSGSSVKTGPLKAGAYYWRLRTASGEGRSFWSSPAGFRIMGLPSARTTPSGWVLEVEATAVGDSLLLKGKVTPRALVTVNDVEVAVDQEGAFMGTFPLPPRGPKGRRVAVCAFDEKGNEKVWEKSL